MAILSPLSLPKYMPSPFSLALTSGQFLALLRSEFGGSYTISGPNGVLGTAFPLDLPTGADSFASLLRVPRKSQEDDFSLLGRLQRLLIVSTQRKYSGSSPRIVRTLAAYLGRLSISQPWDGQATSALPANTSFLDLLDPPPPQFTTLAQLNPLTVSGYSAYQTPLDLTGLHILRTSTGTLQPGRDYLITNDSEIVLAKPTTSLTVASFPQPERISFGFSGRRDSPAFSTEALPARNRFSESTPEYTRISASNTSFPFPTTSLSGSASPVAPGVILRGAGLFVSGLDRITHRLLMQPGGSQKTVLGHAFLESPTLRWSTSITSGYQVPMDL